MQCYGNTSETRVMEIVSIMIIFFCPLWGGQGYPPWQSYNSWSGLPGLPRVLGSLGSIWCWAPYGAGLLGLWAPEGDVPSVLSMVLGSQGCWAPEGAGLPRVLGSQGCWAPKGAGLPRLLGSRVDWAP